MGLKDDPIGGGDGLPEPKRNRKHGKLPGLTRRQTYRVVTAIPIVQLGICFLLFFLGETGIYHIAYKHLANIIGFSLLTGLYYWYAARVIGSCGGAIISIYTLIILNVINILHLAFPMDYYGLYGIATTGAGFLLSLAMIRK